MFIGLEIAWLRIPLAGKSGGAVAVPYRIKEALDSYKTDFAPVLA